ncbi:MAG: SDR family oxidoreductase [Nitrosomonas sp.]|nr:MAG: SDR family oxidoreductase [Nitrosomonas sp.]
MAEIWTDKVIIITGASSGIGRALALALAPYAPKLVLVARDRVRLQAVADSCEAAGAATLVSETDITDPHACFAMVQYAVARFARIDALINNAGISMWGAFEDIRQLELCERVFAVNFWGGVYCTRYALPYLRQSQGRIVTISSLAGLSGIPMHTAYSASKHALHGFFESLRIELAGSGVSITMVAPDFVQSEIHQRSLNADGDLLGQPLSDHYDFLSADRCAKIIIDAMQRRKRLALTSLRGRLGRWAKLCCPQLIDWITKTAINKAYRR